MTLDNTQALSKNSFTSIKVLLLDVTETDQSSDLKTDYTANVDYDNLSWFFILLKKFSPPIRRSSEDILSLSISPELVKKASVRFNSANFQSLLI